MIALFVSVAAAGPLDVALADKTGGIFTPGTHEVGLSFKGGAEGDNAVTWENTESSSLAVVCGDEGKAANDEFSEQLLLQVGEEKWGLAAGSTVKFTCPEGKKATITDIHGTQVAQVAAPLSVTVTKLKARAAR